MEIAPSGAKVYLWEGLLKNQDDDAQLFSQRIVHIPKL